MTEFIITAKSHRLCLKNSKSALVRVVTLNFVTRWPDKAQRSNVRFTVCVCVYACLPCSIILGNLLKNAKIITQYLSLLDFKRSNRIA